MMSHMIQRSTIMATLFSLLGWACTTQAVPPAPGEGASAPAPAEAAAAARAGFTLDGAVTAARADAARRTGLAPAALELVRAEPVTWGDGSLGCPQPGMGYTQALVPGYRVRLRGPAGELDYHASARGALLLCPAGRAVDPLPGASRM